MATRKKKVHIQITQNETDGLNISQILLSKDSWGIYSWEHKDFHFLNQQRMVWSQSGCQCYSHFVMAAQRKQLSMAWNSLRGKSQAGWTAVSAPWKELVIELQTLQTFSSSHSSNNWVTANLLASDKTQLFRITSYKLLVRKMATCKWHIPSLRAGLLHLAGAELDPTNSLLNSGGYLWGSAACWQALSIDSGRAHKLVPWNQPSKPRCKPFHRVL